MFPQIAGLGQSDMSKRYAIKSLDEAKAYLAHPLLGKRLVEITEALLRHRSKTAAQIFGHPDDVKIKSSMTLFNETFALVEGVGKQDSVFKKALKLFFNGEADVATLRILSRLK